MKQKKKSNRFIDDITPLTTVEHTGESDIYTQSNCRRNKNVRWRIVISLIVAVLIGLFVLFNSTENSIRDSEKMTESSVNFDKQASERATSYDSSAVTIASVTGMRSSQMSVVYITLSITLPSNLATSEIQNIQDFGFMEWNPSLNPANGLRAEGSSTTVQSDDGSICTMLMYTFDGDVGDCEMSLYLSNYGDVSKASVRQIHNGEKTIEMPGTWSFLIEDLNLDTPIAIDCTAVMPQNEANVPIEILLSPYGGIATFDSWDSDKSGISSIQIFDSNGNVYSPTVGTQEGSNDNGEYWIMFTFESPQDFSNAEYLSINDAKVKVNVK